MRLRLTRARLLIAGLATLGLLATAQPDAKADCLYVKAYVKRKNADNVWIHGQHNPCVAPTPWPYFVTVFDNDTTTLIGPDGTYGGHYVEVRLPLPSV